MGSTIEVCFLIYCVYKSIYVGHSFFSALNNQFETEMPKQTKKLRNEFIWYLAGVVIFFFSVLGIDL